MDEIFSSFLEKFRRLPDAPAFPEAVAKRYRGRVPDSLIQYWQRCGLCGFNDGSFWFTNPDEYIHLMECLLEGMVTFRPEECVVFARSAFGHLHVWCERIGTFHISIAELKLKYGPRGPLMQLGKRELVVGSHLAIREPYKDPTIDMMDENATFLLRRAQKTLGPLAVDECYGFIPTLLLGGRNRLDHIKKVRLHEHLSILAQLDSLRIVDVSQWPPRQVE